MVSNPYTPGAGFMPVYLAGRDSLIERAESYLHGIQKRYPQQSVIYYGLRGVGKTVLLNSIEMSADNLGILYRHIEASENGNFTTLLLAGINKFLHDISIKKSAKDFVKKCVNLVKSFMVTYSLEDNTIGVGLNNDIQISTGIFSEDITEIFVELGKAALKSDDTICFFIDEVQYLSKEEICGLIIAIHRCNQLRLPIMVFCAGLPKILKSVGEACSYSERLFKFEQVGALSFDAAKDAIVEPARDFNVQYEDSAIQKIVEITGCYPYFIQELCNVVWSKINKDIITEQDVLSSEHDFFKLLDAGFFSVRYNRCSGGEKSFMTAMVKCGELPCTISNVAKILKKEVKSISPTRGKLISKGMIYSTAYAEIDFTVPQFDGFIRRINPDLELK